jgi:dolichyl-phosphate beta-glucosyltransferase
MDSPLVSLVIPAYNEGKRIKKGLITVKEYLSEKPYDTELIVVNDGSEDDTGEIAGACLDGCRNQRVINYSQNRGKGYAVNMGVLSAKGKFIVFMDADMSTPIDELGRVLNELENGYDVVIGTRKNKEAKVLKKQPLYRDLLGKGFTWLTNVLLVKNISDITCGFKGFKKDVGLNLFQRQLIYNWSFDAEILFLGQKLGYRIKEVPVTWIDSEGTKVDLKRDIIGSLKGILQIQINYMLKRYKL